MSANLDGQLVVAISSRALFDLEEENQVFETGSASHTSQEPPPDLPPGVKKDAAYMQLQLERLDVPAKPGVAFSLVKKLLAFNDAPESAGETASPAPAPQRVEVVILSRNDPVSGMRVFRSAQHYGLNIQRGTFNRGAPPWRYLKPLHANLFLSTHLSDVRAALEAGVPAAQVYPQSARASDAHPNEVRIAFDGDAVLFSDEAEMVYQAQGLSAFQAHERAIRTLMNWNIEVDEVMFLGGLEKGPFLREFEPDFFFDDQTGHAVSAALHVPSGHVSSGIANTGKSAG